MRPLLESWRGKKFTAEEIRGFDIVKVAGKPAYLNIVHEEKDGKTYANIASIMPIPNGLPVPQLEGEVLIYDDEHPENFDKLPEWLQTKIKDQIVDEPEPSRQHGAQPVPAGELDDDPFDDSDVPF